MAKKNQEKLVNKQKEKVKLNDKIDKKIAKEGKYISDEAREIRRFAIILISIIIVVLVVYGVSKVFIKENKNINEETVTAGVIDYDKVSIGTMLNRNQDEYYVVIYDGEDANAVLYSALINKYISKEKHLPIYYCDLGNKLNSKYYNKDKSNPNAKTIEELSLKEFTLIKVKNSKIVKYIENLDTFKSELGL